MENESVSHLFHQHPLSLIPNRATEYWNTYCEGCWRYFLPGEAAYGCSQKCGFRGLLHKECMEMPREIRHPRHPSHSLTLQDDPLCDDTGNRCAVCDYSTYEQLIYKCSGGCEWWIHFGCTGNFEAVVDDVLTMKHPSHPQHQLIKNTRSCSFPCDACGATHKGNAYICTLCNYWIHESCALLPVSAHFPHHHPDHSLSLAFNPPYEYIGYDFVCAICSGTLPMRRWVYHCQLCRYVIHINCATNTSSLSLSNSSNNENVVNDAKEIVNGPIDDIYEEIIRQFVKREMRRQIFIPHDHDNQKTYDKYRFPNHPHLLSFTKFSSSSPRPSSHHHNQEEEEEEDDDDDGIPISGLTCDGCTLPIHEKKQTYDHDDEYENGYMSCDECKYFLHLSCFNLPPHLPSLPLHPIQNHNLILRNAGKLTDWTFCRVCEGYTNGLFYECTKCNFTIDIKCASLPNTIKHAAHPQHNHFKLVTDNSTSGSSFCVNCYTFCYKRELYRCNSCRICVCGGCILLPSRNKHRLEKHCLWLTYDAYVNHPDGFYCSNCEFQMDPKSWMYHCRDCDQSFHPECIPGRSGQYRNINYGMQQYMIPTLHHPHHPLRFQIITKKKLCDLCHQDRYQMPGFQCLSCYFVMCIPCSEVTRMP